MTRPLHVAIVTETYPPEVNGVAMTLGRVVQIRLAREQGIPVVSQFHTDFHAYSRHCGFGWPEDPVAALRDANERPAFPVANDPAYHFAPDRA